MKEIKLPKSEKFEKYDFMKSIDLKEVDFKDIIGEDRAIIFDTNFLFTTFEFKIDVISEIRRCIGGNFRLYIYGGTLNELKSVERKGDKNKRFLPLISTMLNVYNFKLIRSSKRYVDGQILENLHDRVVIATNDKELRMKIQAKKKKVLYLRQKKYLELI